MVQTHNHTNTNQRQTPHEPQQQTTNKNKKQQTHSKTHTNTNNYTQRQQQSTPTPTTTQHRQKWIGQNWIGPNWPNHQPLTFRFMEWGFTCGCWFQGFWFGHVRCPLTALRRTAQNFDLFSPLPPFSLFCVSLFGCLLVEFWWCFRRLGPSNVHLWALGLSCEAPAASGPPGFHTKARELQTFTFESPGASTPKFNERTPRVREKER